MRRLICMLVMLFLIMPAFVAEADFYRDSRASLGISSDEVRLPRNFFQLSETRIDGELMLAQNIDGGLMPVTPADGAQPMGSEPVQTERDGFQSGTTFEHFEDPRWAKNRESTELPAEYTHEAPGQTELHEYNLMMKAWQKD